MGFFTNFGQNRLSPPFANIVNAFRNREPIKRGITGCGSSCTTEVQGAGFTIDCEKETTNIENSALAQRIPYAEIIGEGPLKQVQPLVFETSFDYITETRKHRYTQFTMQFKHSTAEFIGDKCPGTLTTRSCTVKPGTVTYPVAIDNGTISLARAPPQGYQRTSIPIKGFEVDKGDPFGGFSLVLNMLYSDSAQLEYTSHWFLAMSQLTSYKYYVAPKGASQNTTIPICAVSFEDPAEDIIQILDELACRTALESANSSSIQNIRSQQTSRVTIFQSNYGFLATAISFTIFTILIILGTCDGWWALGREFSLSPLEIAKAFDAPLLHGADSNAPVEKLKKQVGDRHAKYGEIEFAAHGRSSQIDSPGRLMLGARLGFADPYNVRRPRTGHGFPG